MADKIILPNGCAMSQTIVDPIICVFHLPNTLHYIFLLIPSNFMIYDKMFLIISYNKKMETPVIKGIKGFLKVLL